VTDSLDEARRSIWNLRRQSHPANLSSEVTALAEYFSKDGLTVKTRFRGTYRHLPRRTEEEVLKIVREAITNVSKHASAKEVDVDCDYERETLVVTVRDNGEGFALARGEKAGHFGLVGMRERAAAVGGELSITSAVGTGTLVRLVVPASDTKEAK
jgi:signal transduction histidine kinase